MDELDYLTADAADVTVDTNMFTADMGDPSASGMRGMGRARRQNDKKTNELQFEPGTMEADNFDIAQWLRSQNEPVSQVESSQPEVSQKETNNSSEYRFLNYLSETERSYKVKLSLINTFKK